ncbi:hypothetical protein [Collimonas silvisoli]|uniref:hypothetical protein n=1 Tax=Collimonas silvisoli TaxID=2825884 RepID=UPI001B8D1D2A|nr:hypothetical protein [Collimonas silvisoli]
MKFKLAVVLSLFAHMGFADEPKDDPDHLPYKMTKVVKVGITVASERGDYNPEENCTSYVITPKLATFFFNHAKSISSAETHHLYNLTSCSAKGTVTFANGDEATWTMPRGGVAFMSTKQGKFKDTAIALYCEKCGDWNDWLQAAKK